MPIIAGFNKAVVHVVAAPALAGMLAQSPTYLKKLEMNNQPAVTAMCWQASTHHKEGDSITAQ